MDWVGEQELKTKQKLLPVENIFNVPFAKRALI